MRLTIEGCRVCDWDLTVVYDPPSGFTTDAYVQQFNNRPLWTTDNGSLAIAPGGPCPWCGTAHQLEVHADSDPF